MKRKIFSFLFLTITIGFSAAYADAPCAQLSGQWKGRCDVNKEAFPGRFGDYASNQDSEIKIDQRNCNILEIGNKRINLGELVTESRANTNNNSSRMHGAFTSVSFSNWSEDKQTLKVFETTLFSADDVKNVKTRVRLESYFLKDNQLTYLIEIPNQTKDPIQYIWGMRCTFSKAQ